MATEQFIPVACDDWYQRRRQDAEGEFFRAVAEQGPRKGSGTKQGIYCLTASGQLLAYKNSVDPEVMFDVLNEALKRWKQLPEAVTAPGAISVPDLSTNELDQRFTRTPPANGLILNVYTRALDRDADGKFRECTGSTSGYAGFATAVDHLWLTEADWKSLVPASPTAGQTNPMPAQIAERILRFHLVDNTRGEPPFWASSEIRKQSITLTVVDVTPDEVRLSVSGTVELATSADPSMADRGYDAQLSGEIHIDRRQQRLRRFDLAALGDHWGEGRYTPGARPGRTPLAIVMQLAEGNSAADQVPPQGMRNADEYLSQ